MHQIPDPRIAMLSAAIADLVAGYERVRAALAEFQTPADVQDEVLAPLRSAAERAADALTVAA